jgi:hypothetical protein
MTAVLLLVAAALLGPADVSRSPALDSSAPSIAHDARGRAIAVWQERKGGWREVGEYSVMSSVLEREVWSAPERIHQGTAQPVEPRVFPGPPLAVT